MLALHARVTRSRNALRESSSCAVVYLYYALFRSLRQSLVEGRKGRDSKGTKARKKDRAVRARDRIYAKG
jgi:hypothetical protein